MKSQNENSSTDQKNQKNRRYAFVTKKDEDFSCIKIMDGEYEGVIYKYDKVRFSEKENADGQLPLQFTYDVMVNTDNKDVKSSDFKNYIGDILVECVEEQLKNGTLKLGDE